MAVVEKYQFGNTKVFIHDDAFKSPEEIREIEKRISDIVWRYLAKEKEDDNDTLGKHEGQPMQSRLPE